MVERDDAQILRALQETYPAPQVWCVVGVHDMLDTAKLTNIDAVLREFGHDWIHAPGSGNVIRIAGPDSHAATVVERQEDGYVRCYLWSRVTGDRLGSLTVAIALNDVEEQLLDILTLFHTWREKSGDCCRLPRELHQSELGIVGRCARCDSTIVIHPITDEVTQ